MKSNRLLFFLIIIALLSWVAIATAQEGGEAPVANVPSGPEYVGTDVCGGCHKAYYDSYLRTVHARGTVPGSPATQHGCETCHGPGSEHAARGGGRGVSIFAFRRDSDATLKAGKCLGCHNETREIAFWDLGRHHRKGVSCDSCHTIHGLGDAVPSGTHTYYEPFAPPPIAPKLLKLYEPNLCYGCHRDIRMQVGKQTHHPINEGRIKCTDCHNPHGSFGPKQVRADTINELCYKCHSEKRGPFVSEHPPVQENCLICHNVHGSNHQRLLTKKIPPLCQACHDVIGHPSNAYTSFETFGTAPVTGKNRQFARGCLNCHSGIHGSNGPSTSGTFFIR